MVSMGAAWMVAGTLACAAFADGEPPIPPINAEARAKGVQDPLVACSLVDKTFDAAKHRLTYNLRLRNTTKKAVVKFTGQFTWRDADGKNLVFHFEEVVFDKPLAPGDAITREDVSEPSKGGDNPAEQRKEWEKQAHALTEVRLSVARITYADGTTEVQQVKGDK